MSTEAQILHLRESGPLVVLVGNPNCGKTALFNALTGSQQKVGNYAGVTVERKEGRLLTPGGRQLRLLDLPGAYSLSPRSPDERVTVDALRGKLRGEGRPQLVITVLDATNLRRGLRLVLAVKRVGLPMLVVVNMRDLAEQRGINIDLDALGRELDLPVVSSVAVRKGGQEALRGMLDEPALWAQPDAEAQDVAPERDPRGDHAAVQGILKRLGLADVVPHQTTDRIDRLVLHPILGPILLIVVMFLVFQAVFAWAEAPMTAIESLTESIAGFVNAALPAGWLQSLLVDGVVAGAGGVLIFLPQIVILFFFILILEESGYLPRAAFLLDRLMASIGLSGRSFIPLLSSFACAIPGIMAARTISNPRDRLVTIMVAPLMTCSARLPVYALLIGAFVPQREYLGAVELQGLVLFGLYLAGIVGAMLIAWVLKLLTARGETRALMMELPSYHWPAPRNILMGLWQRVKIFVRRVGGIILALTIVLWFLASYPAPPEGALGAPIEYTFAGTLGRALAVIFEPIGFGWEISIALVPGLAAREVAVSALGTVYALSGGEEALPGIIAGSWSLATALSLLAWYVFAPQCLSTLATVKRETNGWKMPLIMAAYLFGLAYLASFITYRVALALGAGA